MWRSKMPTVLHCWSSWERCEQVIWKWSGRSANVLADRLSFLTVYSGRSGWRERNGRVSCLKGEFDDEPVRLRIAQGNGASAGFNAPLDDGESESETARLATSCILRSEERIAETREEVFWNSRTIVFD